MIRGMSYPKGIFYMDKEYIAHATLDPKGNVVTHLYPIEWKGILFLFKQIVLTIPWYFALSVILLADWVVKQPHFPFYLLLLLAFGYHFIFPYPLRQFHGAEHKMFSHNNAKSLDALAEIKQSNIVNRNCSTNSVVTFYLLFIIGFYPLGGNLASILGVCGVLLIPRLLKSVDQQVIFPVSAFLQRKITTIEPDQKQMMVALLAYISLVRRTRVTEMMLIEEQEHEKERRRLAELAEIERRKHEEMLRIIEETEWLEI